MNKDMKKQLKELQNSIQTDTSYQRVSKIPSIQRIWDKSKGENDIYLPPGTLHEMLSSYCYPFLLYKQVVLYNRDLITKHSETVATQLDHVNTTLPQTVISMKKLFIDFPKDIQTTKDILDKLNHRVKNLQNITNRLMKFNDQMVILINNKIQPSSSSNTQNIIGNVSLEKDNKDELSIHPSLM
ncbi:hypothetical protein QTN25_008141 [Entamoeba marina]